MAISQFKPDMTVILIIRNKNISTIFPSMLRVSDIQGVFIQKNGCLDVLIFVKAIQYAIRLYDLLFSICERLEVE